VTLSIVEGPQQTTFPHMRHEGLFPLCTGCHQGIPSGDESAYYPEATFCSGCHSGARLPEVAWTPPEVGAEANNLAFTHGAHVEAVAAAEVDELDCQACHVPPGASRMTVAPLSGQRCVSCHGHPAERHVVDADCSTCHVPLARTSLTTEQIASLRQPPSHRAPGFVLELHGKEAAEGTNQCATCHTRDTCTSCHVGGNEAVIEGLEPAPASMELPDFEQEYPVPASHAEPDFEARHGDWTDASGSACITCHTQDDCASCHLPPLPRAAAALPARDRVPAPGVGLMLEAPASHESPWFVGEHGSLAASDPDGCASCHTEPFCQSCHEAPQAPAFHPTEYITRHAADAWGASSECASCHQAQASCRACHAQAGLTQTGRLGGGYHDAEPLFLFRHGQAARQSLESCASCHTQKECTQCHSQAGSFQVNPHGSDFDPEAARERNPIICGACHIGEPGGGGI
jgi:hypothetical protein